MRVRAFQCIKDLQRAFNHISQHCARRKAQHTFVIHSLRPLLSTFSTRTSRKDDSVRLLLVEQLGEILDGCVFEGENVRGCSCFLDFVIAFPRYSEIKWCEDLYECIDLLRVIANHGDDFGALLDS
jgi:hypothetical protein